MYRKTVLDNGTRIVSERLEHYRSISLGIWVDVGSRDEVTADNGISHFIEHMVFKGTHKRDSLQIAKELDAIGGLSNAFTGKEHTCFHSKVLDKHFPQLAEILSDIFLNPLFDSTDMGRERQVILQEINMLEDTPDEHIHILFNRLFWADHPIGMSVLGTGESVAAISRETITSHIERFYTPNRIIIAAAGNIDHDGLVAFFKPLFDSMRSEEGGGPTRSAPKTNAGLSCNTKDLEQAHICLGGRASPLKSDLRFACAIFNTMLGGNMSSRLFQEIRENRGLAYSVYSFLSAYIDTGLLGVYVGTDPAEVNRVLDLVKKEIRKMQNGGVTQAELDAAREHLVGGIFLGAESTDTRMMRLAKNEYVFGRYMDFDELVSGLEAVTLDEVVAVAKKTFESNQVSLTTLGPVGEQELDLSCLDFSVE
jgi:predicted Zn-dependent peptidase